MSEHLKRMFDLSRWVAPAEGSAARARLEAWANDQKKNPAFEKQIKKTFKKARAIAWSQLETGAGLPMDQLIRHFSNEYNWRNLHQGLPSMPPSFNVMEAFFRYDAPSSVFRILEERDHLLSFLEFVDFITSGAGSGDIKEAFDVIEDDVIYSYNLKNDPSEMTFSVDAGSEFVVGGVSIVRHGSEISVLLLAGEETDTQAATKKLEKDLDGIQLMPDREWLRETIQSGKHDAVPLLGNPTFWQVLTLTRLNIESMTQDVKYLLWDAGASFIHLSNDVSIYLEEKVQNAIPEWEKRFRLESEKIKEYSAIFEVCKNCVFLPMYFENYAEEIFDERRQTEFADSKHDLKRAQRNLLLAAKEKLLFRRVSVLSRHIDRQPDLISFKAPDFKVENSGFWRSLKLGEVGEDKYGRPIHGRTWVKKTLSWVESKEDEALRVKTRNPGGVEVETDSSGYIYVMRSAAHPKDVFKIGLSKRGSEIRSDELSRETGAPDKFLVAQDWKVSDCVAAERLAHERLEKYRINPKREFFGAPFKTIVKIIDEVIAELEGK